MPCNLLVHAQIGHANAKIATVGKVSLPRTQCPKECRCIALAKVPKDGPDDDIRQESVHDKSISQEAGEVIIASTEDQNNGGREYKYRRNELRNRKKSAIMAVFSIPVHFHIIV